MRRRVEPQCGEGPGVGPEAGADRHRVGLEPGPTGQLHPCEVAVGPGQDPPHRPLDHGHAARPQAVEVGVVDAGTIVDHHREPVGELAEERGGVQAHRTGDDLHHPSVPHLVAVAERAVDHAAAPVARQALDGGQLVGQTGGGEDPSGEDRRPPGQLDPEPPVVAPVHGEGQPGQHLGAVAADLLTGDGRELAGWQALVAQVAVHVTRRGVPGLARVHDDDGPPLAPELEGGGEAGRRSAHDRNVAVPFHLPVPVLVHGSTLRWQADSAHSLARFASLAEPAGADSHRGAPVAEQDIEQIVRTRLRSLRTTMGLSLDELAARTNLSPSTISRVETGKRTISLDVLLPLASALQVDLDELLDVHGDDDVVIRPAPSRAGTSTTWVLSRPTSATTAIKMRLRPRTGPVEQQVHPGHDWFFVIEGRVCLHLGERQIVVEAGEAAEFTTMTPHAVTALDGPAELIMIFDRDGQRAHVHRDGPEGDDGRG